MQETVNLCMSCNGGKITKKRIIILLTVVIGVAATIYTVSVATENFAILAVSPLVLGFIACPLMCGVMGGGMWLVSRLSKNKEKGSLSKNVSGCCKHDHIDEDHYQNKRTSNNSKESIEHIANNRPRNNDDNSVDLTQLQPKSDSKFKVFPN